MTELDKEELERREKIVIEEYKGILPHTEAFYIHSIIYSADRSVEAFQRYNVALSCQSGPLLIASTVHEALTHAAALSRFFWPSRSQGLPKTRGKKLREAFDISESSLLRDRGLRNALEHFDERVDRYLLIHDAGTFFPAPMIDDYSLADEPTAKIFKLIDPNNGYFVILGEKYEFGPIRTEVQRVLDRANKMDCNGCRLRGGQTNVS